MKRAPLSVWIARVFLLLASYAFTILNAGWVASETRRAADFMYPVLLVVLPVFGFSGLLRPAWWGRRVATLGLLCAWGFVLRSLYVWTGVEYFREAFLAGTYFTALIITLAVLAVEVPLLLLQLYRGEAERVFFVR